MSYQRYQPHRSSRPKYIIGGIVLLLVLIGIGGIVWAMSGNKGTIEQKSASQSVTHGPSILDYDSPNITFKYSSTYRAVKQPAGGTSLEMSMLTADTSYEKRLSVAVFPLNASDLDTFSPYETRKVQPNLYSRTDVPIPAGTATVFAKTDGMEITAILLHGGKVTTLSFITGSSYDNLPAEVNTVLQSFRWKQ